MRNNESRFARCESLEVKSWARDGGVRLEKWHSAKGPTCRLKLLLLLVARRALFRVGGVWSWAAEASPLTAAAAAALVSSASEEEDEEAISGWWWWWE
jgi:hypothetical protein